MEYATGSDPQIASSDRMPSLAYDHATYTIRAVTYRNLNAAEAHYEVQSSQDLATWNAAEIENSTTTIDDGVERLQQVIAIDQSTDHEFFRIILNRN